jgi:hypothetical protein
MIRLAEGELLHREHAPCARQRVVLAHHAVLAELSHFSLRFARLRLEMFSAPSSLCSEDGAAATAPVGAAVVPASKVVLGGVSQNAPTPPASASALPPAPTAAPMAAAASVARVAASHPDTHASSYMCVPTYLSTLLVHTRTVGYNVLFGNPHIVRLDCKV